MDSHEAQYARLARRAMTIMGRMRALFIANIFTLGRLARARAERDELTVSILQPQVLQLAADMRDLQRQVLSVRNQLHALRLTREGKTTKNWPAVPATMPEGEL